MDQGVIGTKVITQIGILVDDIEATSQAYADFFGVKKPKWHLTAAHDIAQTEYNGSPTQAKAKLAFFDMGSLQLELIEPDHHPSTWREHLDAYGEGPHHIAFVIDGMQAAVQRLDGLGMKLIQKGEYTGGRYAYIDTSKDLKMIFELLENDAAK